MRIIIYVVFSFSLFCNADADADASAEISPIWTKVEIISNDKDLIKISEKVIEIQLGESIEIDDPRLKNECNRVRSTLPNNAVMCTAILESGNKYIYVVQISTTKNKYKQHEKCNGEKILDADLLQLAREIDEDATNALLYIGEEQQGEYVNSDDILTYREGMRAIKSHYYNSKLLGKSKILEHALFSCFVDDRETTLRLMNYSGDKSLVKKSIPIGIEDSEVNVRNNAFRLASTFAYLYRKDEQHILIVPACKALRSEIFFDINKSLATLNSISSYNNNLINELPPGCIDQIIYLADISKTDQISGFAKRLILKLK